MRDGQRETQIERKRQRESERERERERERDYHCVWHCVCTCATRSVCSFWNMRLRASQASPAMSARDLIPAIRGPMVSSAAIDRTHSYTHTHTHTH